MFRISRYLKIAAKKGGRRQVTPPTSGTNEISPVVIWNLTRRCNLECIHCYASASPRDFAKELSTDQALATLDDMKQAGVLHIIFSGGEPTMREDLDILAGRAKELGFMTSLSSNGTLIGDKQADMIKNVGFDYVGISLDGMKEAHDEVRGAVGSFDSAVAGLFRLKERKIRCGARFTLTKKNIVDLPKMFRFVEDNDINKLYLSHLVYSGRGSANKAEDLTPEETREAMELVHKKTMEYVKNGVDIQVVTGNNDADAVFTILKLGEESHEMAEKVVPLLQKSGGNSAGIGVANIDPTGQVHPDPLMSSVNLGNVTEKSFGEIWRDNENPTLARLRERPRKLNGRCGQCAWIDVCGGNTRVRAQNLTGDLWGSDPACYLTDEEINAEVSYSV